MLLLFMKWSLNTFRYIGIPTDIAFLKTPSFNLKVPLETVLPPNNPVFQAHVIDQIRALMDAASNPIIIVDGGMSLSETTSV